jgi:hypothetical protein
MPKKRIRPKVEASAKAQVVGKVVYQRKRTTSEFIPPDVTRAKAGAWLDLISPLTEWAGLKGDELRYRRAQLRLQREDVLADIVSRSRKRLESKQEIVTPVPNKFIVPFLEQASLEDPDSELVDMWANLLATAATDYSSYHVHFVSIMSQLSAKQGNILKYFIGVDSAYQLEVGLDNISVYFQSSQIRNTIKQKFERDFKPLHQPDYEAVAFAMRSLFQGPGLVLVHIAGEEERTGDYYDIEVPTCYKDKDEIDYSILEAVGLVRRVETDFFDVCHWAIVVTYYHLTELGLYFAKACGLAKKSDGMKQFVSDWTASQKLP